MEKVKLVKVLGWKNLHDAKGYNRRYGEHNFKIKSLLTGLP
jgi:hypothetical protein